MKKYDEEQMLRMKKRVIVKKKIVKKLKGLKIGIA